MWIILFSPGVRWTSDRGRVVVIPRKLARQALVRVSLVVAVLSVFVVAGGIAGSASAAEVLRAGIKISLNCTASAERIRVTNDTGNAIVVRSIGTLVDPRPGE